MAGGLVWFALAHAAPAGAFTLLNLGNLIASGDPRGMIGAGMLLLLLTPLGRVVASLVHFTREKDTLYAGLTALVIASLLAAVALGAV